MTTILNTASSLSISQNADKWNIRKEDCTGIKTRQNLIILILTNGDNIKIDFNDGLTIDGVAQTTVSMGVTTLEESLKSGIIETFIATAGQTTFSPVFECNALTRVYVGGYRIVAGWNVVAGDIEFVAPMVGGEEVILENV